MAPKMWLYIVTKVLFFTIKIEDMARKSVAFFKLENFVNSQSRYVLYSKCKLCKNITFYGLLPQSIRSLFMKYVKNVREIAKSEEKKFLRTFTEKTRSI